MLTQIPFTAGLLIPSVFQLQCIWFCSSVWPYWHRCDEVMGLSRWLLCFTHAILRRYMYMEACTFYVKYEVLKLLSDYCLSLILVAYSGIHPLEAAPNVWRRGSKHGLCYTLVDWRVYYKIIGIFPNWSTKIYGLQRVQYPYKQCFPTIF